MLQSSLYDVDTGETNSESPIPFLVRFTESADPFTSDLSPLPVVPDLSADLSLKNLCRWLVLKTSTPGMAFFAVEKLAAYFKKLFIYQTINSALNGFRKIKNK